LEFFDVDRAGEALARFDELVATRAAPMARAAVRRRVQQNAATANVERLGAAIAGRDFDAPRSLFADTYSVTDHYLGRWDINRRLRDAMDARDWDALASAALVTPDFVFEDHRPMGAGVLSRDEFIALICAMVELRPDAILRLDHILAFDDRGSLFVAHWAGDAAAGQFEIPSIGVDAAAADGRMRRSDLFAPDQLDEAWARFTALGAPLDRGRA
jgi:hypothetical protein